MLSKEMIKGKIIRQFNEKNMGLLDSVGYFKRIENNLIDGMMVNDFFNDLHKGSGNELTQKFRAIHSSSALVVNHFAIFKREIEKLKLLGFDQFIDLKFEEKMPTGLRGTSPNLDVVITNNNYIFGIESKYLEHCQRKKASFSSAYTKEKLPFLRDGWFQLIEKYRNQYSYLDTAQLIKHSIGLLNHKGNRKPGLIYLFWEPENYYEYDLFRTHRTEIELFSQGMKGLGIDFYWLSYLDLWNEWDANVELKGLSKLLRERYLLKI
ncbi:PGN_0703 family putative restriction endonuclease [Falsibacillus pallidus]|uniref:PGN_0703 family putative restriction endonuclease n=1 Tax=Falsibacillus pallidus TaxID=493781 RepID=UPI003D9588F5